MKMDDIDIIWKNILQDLKVSLQEVTFNMLVRPLGIKSFDNKKLILIANNRYWKKMLVSKCLDNIHSALKKYTKNPEIKLEIIVDENFRSVLDENSGLPEKKPEEINVEQIKLPLNEAQIDGLKLTSFGLNTKYSFDNFVVAPCNKFAYACAREVSEHLGSTYNPLFIWGKAGLGKTHLMHAIGIHILFKRHDLKLKYVTTNDFTTDFTNMLLIYKNNPHKRNEFLSKYRNVDILLIDDVQFLEGKKGTQDELFSIFDYLHRNGKQIILTADRPPRDIPTLTDRLRSRFEWGMLAEITPPAFDARVEILKHKAKLLDLSISDDVLEFIAGVFKNNVRELEGGLNKVVAFSQINEQELNLQTAKDALNFASGGKKLSMDIIIEYVGNYFHIEPSEIKGQSRTKDIANARQITIYLSRELLKASYPQIGSALDKKHQTIIYSYEKTKELQQTDKNIKRDINAIIKKLEMEYQID